MRPRIVVTGMGVVSPLGETPQRLWEGVASGESAVRPATEEWDAMPKSAGLCRVDNFVPPSKWETSDRQIQFAVAAAQSALKDAGLDQTELKEHGAVYLSSSKGGMESFEKEHLLFLQNGKREPSKYFFENFLSSSPSSAVARSLGCYGPTLNLVSACASGAHSIMMGSRLIQQDPRYVVLAGATEASLTPLVLNGFKQLGVLAENKFSPFDVSRNGFVAGEGSAVLVLESLEQAQERGGRIYAELAGSAALSDATHMIRFDPSGESIARTIEQACQKIPLQEIDYINLHGTATVQNDLIETRAVKKVWRNGKIPALSSTKPATGHLLGASGALEAVITILALKHQFVPPTLNLYEPDPECDLDYTPLIGKKRKIGAALSLSYGFGGHTAALIFKKSEIG